MSCHPARRFAKLALVLAAVAGSSVVLSGCLLVWGRTVATPTQAFADGTSAEFAFSPAEDICAEDGGVETVGVQWAGTDEIETATATSTSTNGDGVTLTGFTASLASHPEGGSLRVQVVCNGSWFRTYGWSTYFDVVLQQPQAVVYALQSPAFSEGTTLDARMSRGAETYAWSPAECANADDPAGSPLPAGQSRVVSGFAGTCSVTVANAAGRTSTAAVAVMTVADLTGARNGELRVAGTTLTVLGSWFEGLPERARAVHACVDLDGGTRYATAVPLALPTEGDDLRSTGSTPLTALTPGWHRVSATLWSTDATSTCPLVSNPKARAGYVQTVSLVYRVDGGAGAARRATAFTGPSTLRFGRGVVRQTGSIDATGTVTGLVVRGRFTWRTPARSGRVRRPAGLTALRRGDYVARADRLQYGPKVANLTEMIGTATVLLRGADGALACGTLTSTGDATTFTLIGGTRSARRVRATVTSGKGLAYAVPKPSTKQPVTKGAKSKSTSGTGTITATLGSRIALPAACAALKRDLP